MRPATRAPPSNEVTALPHLEIGWANLQWPPTLTHTISAVSRTADVYGQVWIDGVTNLAGPAPSLEAQLGFGPDGSDPASAAWTWVDAAFNTNAGNNDEFVASLLPDAVGTYDYAYRYSTTGGRSWVYADLDGIGNGYSPAQAGSLTVVSSGDTTAPAVPTGLHVVSASPAGIDLAWTAVAGDPSLYGYEVLRNGQKVALVTGTSYTDLDVEQGASYTYAVRSVDTSFNRSGPSASVTAVADLRTVTVTFTLTVPAATDGTGRSVYIAGTLNRLDGGLPEWNPARRRAHARRRDALARDPDGPRGDAARVQVRPRRVGVRREGRGLRRDRQPPADAELRGGGTQAVNDTALNWRNVAPCGN